MSHNTVQYNRMISINSMRPSDNFIIGMLVQIEKEILSRFRSGRDMRKTYISSPLSQWDARTKVVLKLAASSKSCHRRSGSDAIKGAEGSQEKQRQHEHLSNLPCALLCGLSSWLVNLH